MSADAVHGYVKLSQRAARGRRQEKCEHEGQAGDALCRHMRVHGSGAKHNARELGGCRSTSATQC
jgi:hypothetical protein